MWDDYERALVDAYLNWKNDVHLCGRLLSESLHLEGRPDPEYVVGELTCLGCKAEAKARARAEARWKPSLKEGAPNPMSWTLFQVFTREEAKQKAEEQARGR